MASSGSEGPSAEPVESPQLSAEASAVTLSLRDSLWISSIPGMDERLTQVLSESAALQHSIRLVRDAVEDLQVTAQDLRSDVQVLQRRVQLLETRLHDVEDHNGKTLQLLKGQAEALDEPLLGLFAVGRPFRARRNELLDRSAGCFANFELCCALWHQASSKVA
ncbi:hypothetical protein AK812_SmicGene44662 [Symbiodinium microadriaticum]|uniref:Uncharacterized protein n=1 Tax=Symbiodinium microadriaticum TaxID=2951 RepID=A0A1Q9BXW6_SYMMI|nr:hypothetical protein AK812_SmicGene44662 [Symbiodinium microadriaticum]CAE7564164.1 unnamed protein product [Symbiodinium microadriaticum]CAE7851795.1 unnamed protein product [Symbiodinium sp. KB8]